MKKIISLLAIMISGLSFAQVTFNPGIRIGANISHFSDGPAHQAWNYTDSNHYYYYGYNTFDVKSKVDLYIGFQGNIRFAKIYALQPELYYSRQGARFESQESSVPSKTVTVSYIGAAMVNKFYFDKFNIHFGPTLELLTDHKNIDFTTEADLGILLGTGYDITKNIGVEARIKKGFVHIYNDHTNVTFQAGVYYTFNMKK
ncbi:PorT family protein [Chryseobacterium sp. SSA4.19]|uniref:outer membrane beta-barrel protein n=1 Tax=Chryseobacterium sp. SSA4.19 TaxID=2919915 RepID=UPI001F4EFAB2|nr:outer membrane beta-barrel protein [Chryseobacterium sp. SSA4.19]MCJ8154450.1 PorT family protein [Chryseobacterium sp. SSA4.19]